MWKKMPDTDSKFKEAGEDGSLEKDPCQTLRMQERKAQRESSLKIQFCSAENKIVLPGNSRAQQIQREYKGRV